MLVVSPPVFRKGPPWSIHHLTVGTLDKSSIPTRWLSCCWRHIKTTNSNFWRHFKTTKTQIQFFNFASENSCKFPRPSSPFCSSTTIYIHINLRQKTPNSLSLSSISLRILENKYQICELRMARGGSSSSNASRLRKRVDAEDASSTSTALKRARDGSAFARWCSFLAIPFVRLRLDLLFELLFWYQVGLINCSEGCNKDVAVALISFHDCGLDAKIKMNLGT